MRHLIFICLLAIYGCTAMAQDHQAFKGIPINGTLADFAKKLGLNLEGDSIKTDEKMATNAKGIYSCGNVNGGLLQICKAVYEGGVAGLSAVEYVRGLKK